MYKEHGHAAETTCGSDESGIRRSALLTTVAWGGRPAAAAADQQGAVYALTNAAAGNAVAIYDAPRTAR